jgi:hypothetical protein
VARGVITKKISEVNIMGDRLNVLSIDWDYFINADMCERMELFPDGGNENLSLFLGNTCWSGHYYDGKLEQIKTDAQAIKKVKECLKKHNIDSIMSYMIADSHKHAYEFVHEYCDAEGYDSLNLVNIDYHHDVYSNGDGVDCGNWLAKLIKDFDGSDSQFTWVARHDSDMNLGVSLDGCENKLLCVEDLDIIDEYQWDIVYICRSSMWSPPHLDRKFINAFGWLLDGADDYSCRYETNIFEDRYEVVKEMAKSYKDALQNMGDIGGKAGNDA